MFKYCFSIIFSLMFVSTSFASDKIYLNNGLIIDGTVTQIDIESVTIKYGDKDLTRALHKDAIKVIIYEDGTAETFPMVEIVKDEVPNNQNERLEQRQINVKGAKTTGVIVGALGAIGFCILLIVLASI